MIQQTVIQSHPLVPFVTTGGAVRIDDIILDKNVILYVLEILGKLMFSMTVLSQKYFLTGDYS